jgi:hypothetical protein
MANESRLGHQHHNMIPADAGEAAPSVIWRTEDGIMLAYGTTLPNAVAGYAIGALFVKTGATDPGLYQNNGTAVSCDFGSITAASFVGDLTGNVTGGVTGDTTGTHTGPVVGDVTGDLTGVVTTAIVAGSITATPTQAELVAILGAAAAGENTIRLVQGNAGTGDGLVYVCTSDGTNWFAAQLAAGTA